MFYVLYLFEDFDLATKRPLAIDVCICSNHQELRSRPASLSAGSKAWHALSDDVSDLSISSQFQISDKMQFFTLRDFDKVFAWKCLNFRILIMSGQQQSLQLSLTFLSISSYDRRCPSPQSSRHHIG